MGIRMMALRTVLAFKAACKKDGAIKFTGIALLEYRNRHFAVYQYLLRFASQ